MCHAEISQQIYPCCRGEKKDVEEKYFKNLQSYYKGNLKKGIKAGLTLFKTYFYTAVQYR